MTAAARWIVVLLMLIACGGEPTCAEMCRTDGGPADAVCLGLCDR